MTGGVGGPSFPSYGELPFDANCSLLIDEGFIVQKLWVEKVREEEAGMKAALQGG